MENQKPKKDQDVIQLIGSCKKCNCEKKGKTYKYFYGRMLDRTSSPGALGGQTIIKTTFLGVGSDNMFLCDSCVLRSTYFTRIFLFVAAVILAIITIYFSISFYSLAEDLLTKLCCLLPGLFIGLFVAGAFIYNAFCKITNDDGESLAVALAEKNMIQGKGIIYWTTKKNSEMKKT